MGEVVQIAGYDVSFYVKPNMRKPAQQFLRYIRSVYTETGLKFRYRTTLNGKVEVYIMVDGPLPSMQYIHRKLPTLFYYYILHTPFAKEIVSNIIAPFYKANTGSLKEITSDIFELVSMLESEGLQSEPNRFALGPKLITECLMDSRQRLQHLAFISLHDRWVAGTLNNKEALILTDQALEEWLKNQTTTCTRFSTDGLPKTLDKAVGKGIILRAEKEVFGKIHSIRSGAQHRGETVDSQSVLKMFEFIIQMLNRFSSD